MGRHMHFWNFYWKNKWKRITHLKKKKKKKNSVLHERIEWRKKKTFLSVRQTNIKIYNIHTNVTVVKSISDTKRQCECAYGNGTVGCNVFYALSHRISFNFFYLHCVRCICHYTFFGSVNCLIWNREMSW